MQHVVGDPELAAGRHLLVTTEAEFVLSLLHGRKYGSFRRWAVLCSLETLIPGVEGGQAQTSAAGRQQMPLAYQNFKKLALQLEYI